MSPDETSKVPPTYRKLPGDFRGFFRRNTLWLGGDHVLLVDSSRFSETYKRFYLRDIQTIIVRKTPRFVLPYYWVLLAAVALIVLMVGITPFRELFFWPPVLILGAVVIYLYVASMFQSCTCHLVTRVNNVVLPSLFRLRAGRRFVEILAPQIIAAQGELPADWVSRSTTLEELSTAAVSNPEAPIDLLPTGQFSWITAIVFFLVLGDAGMTWLQLRTNDSSSFSSLNMANLVVLAIGVTIAVVRLTRQKGTRALRMLVLAGLFVVAAATYGLVMLQSFDQQLYHQNYRNMMLYAGMRQLGIAEIVADLAVALPGLVLVFRQMQRPEKAAGIFMGEPKP